MFCKRLPTNLLLVVLALTLLVGAAGATTPERGGDFTLHGPEGPVSLSDLRGKVVLIFFGYTSCPDVCPISLARINACFSAMNEMELERVRALFITLDPERDTSERLEQYTNYFHANIIGLRDDIGTINAVTDRYGVEFAKKELPDSALGYSISHPTDIFVLDTSGRLVEQVPHDADPKYLLARIRDLLNASD